MPVAGAANRALLILGLVLLGLLWTLAPALAGSRLALVIGNGAYTQVSPLVNPLNDAADMARRLEEIGFEVTLATNLDRSKMNAAIRNLRRRAQQEQASVVALFYAGHGVQVDGINYLLPVDMIVPESRFDLDDTGVRVPDVLRNLQDAAQTALVFIDACREDPFKAVTRNLRRSTSFAEPEMEPPGVGMLVAWSAGNGELAADGEGRNSPFTAALLEHIATPGVDIRQVLGMVRDSMEKSRTEQVSVTSDRIRGQFVLVEAKPEPAPTEAPDIVIQTPPPPDELIVWQGIQNSTEASDFELFLQDFPQGRFARFARTRLERLQQQVALERTAAPQPPAEAAPAPEPEYAPAQASEPPAAPEPEAKIAALPDPRHGAPAPALVAPAPPPLQPTPAPPTALPTPVPATSAPEDGLRPGPPPAERMWTRSKVNLRASPSRTGLLLGSLAPSTELTVLASRGGWLEVQSADGQHGYVFGELVTTQEPTVAAVTPATPAPTAAKGGRKVGEVFRDCPDCPELVAIAPQAGTIGSPVSEPGRYPDEGAPQTATIGEPLAVGRHEVTFAEWDACVAAGGCGKYRPSDKGWGRGSRPVINVSHADAQAYVTWLSRKTGKDYRLLREAEWELLARGGSSGPNPWNDDERRACSFANGHDETSRRVNALGMLAFACDDGFAATAPVGSFAPNSLGLFDMLGNVAEWTADCYGPAPTLGGTPPARCAERVVRGGSWAAPLDDMRYARRLGVPPTSRTSSDGFRVARGLSEGLLDRGGAPLVAGGG
jgi:formylglycine-generating enzyme required for sulfatase activity